MYACRTSFPQGLGFFIMCILGQIFTMECLSVEIWSFLFDNELINIINAVHSMSISMLYYEFCDGPTQFCLLDVKRTYIYILMVRFKWV